MFFISGWSQWTEHHRQPTGRECEELLQEIRNHLEPGQSDILAPERCSYPRPRNYRIAVRPQGDAWVAADTIRRVIKNHASARHGQPLRVRVQDSPEKNEQRQALLRAARTIEGLFPVGSKLRCRLDWPDRVWLTRPQAQPPPQDGDAVAGEPREDAVALVLPRTNLIEWYI